MAGQESAGTPRRARPAPAIVTPLTKVNLALPFSKITVEEPGKDLAELASVVAALATVLERTADELTGYHRPGWLASRTTMAQADPRDQPDRPPSGARDLDRHEAVPGSPAAARGDD